MSLPAVWLRIPLLAEKYHVPLLPILGHYFNVVSLGKTLYPNMLQFDSGVNEYLVGLRWQCVRLIPSAEIAASDVCSTKGVEMIHE